MKAKTYISGKTTQFVCRKVEKWPPGKVNHSSWLLDSLNSPGWGRGWNATSLSATAKVLMSWAKHRCLLKIERSYQLVAEDTPLSAPWSDNSPLCWAIGFPPSCLSAPPTVLHKHCDDSLPSLLWSKQMTIKSAGSWRNNRTGTSLTSLVFLIRLLLRNTCWSKST